MAVTSATEPGAVRKDLPAPITYRRGGMRDPRLFIERAHLTPEEQIRDLSQVARFLSEEKFTWQGVEYDFKGKENPLVKVQDHYPLIVGEVAMRMYGNLYVQPDGGRAAGPRTSDHTLHNRFLSRLKEAHATEASWEPGWERVGKDGDRIRVRNRRGDEESVDPEDLDAEGRLRRPASAAFMQTGWYYLRGEETHHLDNPGAGVRVYWNVCSAGALPLVATLSQALNDAHVPYVMKIVDEPSKYTRADSLVLYLSRKGWDQGKNAIRSTYRDVRHYLKGPTPLLTKRLARGLAVANDPGNGQSFGVSRVRAIAEGLWDAHERGEESDEAIHRAVVQRLETVGIDVKKPYLNPGEKELNLKVESMTYPFTWEGAQ